MDEALIDIQARVGSRNGKPFPENSTTSAQHYEFFAAGMSVLWAQLPGDSHGASGPNNLKFSSVLAPIPSRVR
jgi:hypothetical protein